jgi:hypothetical protein
VDARTELLISVDGAEATDEDGQLLASWLREDPELAGTWQIGTRARPAPDAMGAAEFITAVLVQATAEIGVYALLRSAYDYLRNRSHRRLAVTVQVDETTRLTLDSSADLTRQQLTELAERARDALRDGRDELG